ncbi:hypothetical protein Cgig2_012620 [Carnegiea gigantea]|uniref:tRNA/rRNA methyltransferase SpoU type domain-containing protein n=1 Tax=Carnegiea gigantea TaxID=171969 RepID=A0A9Q1JHF9_9CARY|nr:hypothetical protein Cgig2_012620 [Carnegiea gigantea]
MQYPSSNPSFILALGANSIASASAKGTGLSTKELEICDFFVYIPQYGCGTASLNVTVAASIVLHHFAGKIVNNWSMAVQFGVNLFGVLDCRFPVWSGFPERTREGNKFLVAERPARQTRRSFCAESEDAVIEERRIRRENAANEFFSENADDAAPANLLNTLFDDAEENNIDFDSYDKLCIASG